MFGFKEVKTKIKYFHIFIVKSINVNAIVRSEINVG